MRQLPLFLFAIILVSSSAVLGQAELKLRGDSPLLAGLVRTRTADTSRKALPSAASVERQAFVLLNAERTAKGLEELVWNDAVAEVAREHSRNMAEAKFFSHQGSDGSMVDDRADRMGLGNWSAIGENIAFLKGFDNPAEFAVEKWMQSPSHRKNLLGKNWRESAVGVAITPDGTFYFTQVFILTK